MPTSRPPPATCPNCSAALRRVRRPADGQADARADDPADDKADGTPKGDASDARTAVCRYRCAAAACGWEGLLPRPVRRSRRSRRLAQRRWLRQLRTVFVPALALAGLAAAAVAVSWQAGLFTPKPTRLYARGEFHDGEPLPQAHPLTRHHARAQLEAAAEAASAAPLPSPLHLALPSAAPRGDTLALRHGCVWGQPGRSPYRGTVEQALRSAALPEEIVKAVAAQVKAGTPTDRLEIRNEGVYALGSGRVFNAQNIALSYGQTLCLSSRVNFAEGHVEPAALYEATTAGGRVVAVMVPEVCGNVSVLGQSADAPQAGLKAVALGDDPSQMRWMPAVLEGQNTGGDGARSQRLNASQDVPEPSTLACVLAALSGMGFLRWWLRRPVR